MRFASLCLILPALEDKLPRSQETNRQGAGQMHLRNRRSIVHGLVPSVAVVLTLVLASPNPLSAVPEYITQAVADKTRPGDDRDLDAKRRPAATLAQAGVKPGEVIGEYLPGGGYYTRLLSDIVGHNGRIYVLETTTWGDKNVDSTKALLAEPGRDNVVLDLAPLGTFHLPEKVDPFWTTLNYHDLHIPKYANVDMAAFN
jgi:predicted methyltransferase